MYSWLNYISEIRDCMDGLVVSDVFGKMMEPDRAFANMKDMTLKIKEKDCRIILIGNGASASMASHTAADLSKNAGIQAEVFTDLALITALGNDLCFEEVFAEPLKWRLKQDDMLVAISSSGQSPNIIRAAGEAVNRGSLLITLSAMKPDNPLRKLGSLNFYVPAQAYGLAETSHAAILHFWVDQMIRATQLSM